MGICRSFSANCRKEARRSLMNFAVLRHRLLFSVLVFRAIFPWFKKFPVALIDPVPRGVGMSECSVHSVAPCGG
jgi:hypothetical protein